MQYTQQNIAGGQKLFYAWFEAMHTRIDIALCVAVERNDLLQLIAEMEAVIRKYESVGNRFDPQSEISNVNRYAFDSEMTISDELYNLLYHCQLYNEKTFGYFDISVYSTTGLRKDKNAFLLNMITKTVHLSHEGVMLDLSGFLKGYVLGELMKIADNNKINDILINVGNSSIYAKGNHPVGVGWKIKIPKTDTEIVLHNQCLTTSGNTELTKWPIMNPLNGEVIKNKTAVSVITKFPDEGEVLSKVSYMAPQNELVGILKYYDATLVASEK
ncbi:MAG: FAD:protein FMN transferase [Paludibacter sp.]